MISNGVQTFLFLKGAKSVNKQGTIGLLMQDFFHCHILDG